MTRTRLAAAALMASAFAVVALGQNADKNSAGPTKNDYRLRVVEPAEGGTVAGQTVRVVVNTEIPAEAGDARRDVNSMPRPDVDVFLDNQLKGTMRDAQNVLEITDVTAGEHKIVLLAKNRANEIIDRKEIRFSSTSADTAASAATSPAQPVSSYVPPARPATTSSASSMSSTSTTASDSSLAGPAVTAPSDGSASSWPGTTSPAPSSLSASGTLSRSAASAATRSAGSSPRTLPATGSSDATLALAGAALLLAGGLVRRLV